MFLNLFKPKSATTYQAKYDVDVSAVNIELLTLMQLIQLYHVDVKLQFVMKDAGQLNILYRFELPADKVHLSANLTKQGYDAAMQVYGKTNILLTPDMSFDNVILLANVLTCKVILGVMNDAEAHLKHLYKRGKVPAKSFSKFKWLCEIRTYLEQRIADGTDDISQVLESAKNTYNEMQSQPLKTQPMKH